MSAFEENCSFFSVKSYSHWFRNQVSRFYSLFHYINFQLLYIIKMFGIYLLYFMVNHFVYIDDDHLTLALIRIMAEKVGFCRHYYPCEDGAAGLNIIREILQSKHDTTVIFLDINLPIMDGWTCLDHLGSFNPAKICVYMVSSSLSALEKRRAMQHPLVRDFIQKPLSLDLFNRLKEGFSGSAFSVGELL